MSNDFIRTNRSSFSSSANVSYDIGLRQYMLKVYNNMGIALSISGLVSFIVANSPQMMQVIFGTPLQWLVLLAPICFVFFFHAKVHKISAASAQNYLWIF